MVRTVRVRLELDRDDYKSGLRDAAASTRDFDGEVRTLGNDAERTGTKIKSTGTELRSTATEIKSTAREVDQLGTSAKRTGDEMGRSGEKVKSLGAQLREARASVRQFADEYARTGQVDPFMNMQSGGRRVRDLEDYKARIEGLAKEAERDIEKTVPAIGDSGMKAGDAFGQGFMGTLAQFAGPAALAFGVPLVAFLGAAVAGAVLGGTAFAAIGTGLALQFEHIKPAVTDLGQFVAMQLRDATTGFVPAFNLGISYLRRDIEPLWGQLKQGFESLAPYITIILAKLGEGLAKLGPGLSRALEAAGPILERIAMDLPMVFNGFNIMFDEISKGGKGATEAIDAILRGVAMLAAGVGFVIRGLSDTFDFMWQASDKITGVLAKIPGMAKEWAPIHDYVHAVATSFDGMGASALGAAGDLGGITGAAGAAAAAVQNLNQVFDSAFGAAMSLDQAEIGVRQALLGVAEAAKSNGTSLDISSKAGQANASALLQAAQAAQSHRQALLNSGQAAAYADAQYQGDIDSLYAAAGAAGFNAGQVDQLIGKYRSVPGDVNTQILTPGMAAAISNAQSLSSLLHSLDGKVVTSTIRNSIVTTYYANNPGQAASVRPAAGQHIAYAEGGIHAAAAEGMIVRSPTVLFGERGTVEEAFIPRAGIAAARGLALADTAARWHGGHVVAGAVGMAAPMVLDLTLRHEYPDGRVIIQKLRPEIRSKGGNVQAALGPA